MRRIILLMFVLAGCSQQTQTENSDVDPKFDNSAKPSKIRAASRNVALDEQIATVLNLNGHLCARVVDVKPLQVRPNTYEVTCVEYRGGSGQVRYILDAAKGVATEA